MKEGNAAKAEGHEEKVLVIHATKRKKCELTLPDRWFQTIVLLSLYSTAAYYNILYYHVVLYLYSKLMSYDDYNIIYEMIISILPVHTAKRSGV